MEITIKNPSPYKVGDTLKLEIYLNNNTDTLLNYFDTRGSSWESFKEIWELSCNNQRVEVLPLNNWHDAKFTDSTIISLLPGEQSLLRTKEIPLKSDGDYSFTYTQHHSYKNVQKHYADSSVSDSAIQSITTFSVSENIKFQVEKVYNTNVDEIINMSWEDWKDYRHTKLHSRKQHFDNIYDAFNHAQYAYSLTVTCNGMDEGVIKNIGQLKNLRKLTLRRYNLDYYPIELVALDLYELSIVPIEDSTVNFPNGLSNTKSIRTLNIESYNGFPDSILNLNKLIQLEINDCPIKTIPNLGSLENLQVLIANNADINSIDECGLETLTHLKELNLSGNKKIDSIEPILQCYNMEFLVINRTSIKQIPDEIMDLSKLKKLSVSNGLTHISDSLGTLSDMRYLSFGGNRKLTAIPQSIVNMKKLLHFDISSTLVTEIPEGLSELPLEKVYIYRTDCQQGKDYRELKRRLGENFKD